MIKPSHFMKALTVTEPIRRMFYAVLQHKGCGGLRPTAIEADTFSEALLSLSAKCPRCGKVGGPANWDSLPIGEMHGRKL